MGNPGGLSFGMRGGCSTRRRWAGKWWKPWTWRKYVHVVERFELVSVDVVRAADTAVAERVKKESVFRQWLKKV